MLNQKLTGKTLDKKQAYEALSDLIFKGFLTTELDLDGELFVFKTVNEREFELIKLLSGSPETKGYSDRFNSYFLAYSLIVSQGKNCLEHRDQHIAELLNVMGDIPAMLYRKILENLNTLRKDSYDSLRYLEGFLYTRQSRKTWQSLNGVLPSSTEATGIPGTGSLGLNIFQENWVSVNKSMDVEEQHNRDFYLALMVASASNPKGSRSIRNNHETQAHSIEERREKLARVGFIDTKDWSEEGWAAPVDTAEELVAELERQMAGKKDRHDIFMEKYLNGLREEADRRAKAAEERLKKARESYDNVFIMGDQRELTPEETKELMGRKTPTVVSVKDEGEVNPEDQNKFYNKIGKRVLTSAN
jgi:hypothetical protein